jgi:hypothetical protein
LAPSASGGARTTHYHGTAGSEHLMAKCRDGALPWPRGYPTHGPGKKMRAAGHWSRTATWWRISTVRGGSVGWLRWTGKSTTPWDASPRWVGALGPGGEERGRPVRFGDGESIVETGAEALASLPMDRKPVARTKSKEGGVLMYPHYWRMDGTARMAACARGELSSSVQWQGGACTCAADRRGLAWRLRRVALCLYAAVWAELAKWA